LIEEKTTEIIVSLIVDGQQEKNKQTIDNLKILNNNYTIMLKKDLIEILESYDSENVIFRMFNTDKNNN
jgi:hypothetical protein